MLDLRNIGPQGVLDKPNVFSHSVTLGLKMRESPNRGMRYKPEVHVSPQKYGKCYVCVNSIIFWGEDGKMQKHVIWCMFSHKTPKEQHVTPALDKLQLSPPKQRIQFCFWLLRHWIEMRKILHLTSASFLMTKICIKKFLEIFGQFICQTKFYVLLILRW